MQTTSVFNESFQVRDKKPKPSFFRKYLAVIIAALLLVGAFAMFLVNEARLSSAEAQLELVEASVAVSEAETPEVNEIRMEADGALMKEIITIATTWDSGPAYVEARNKIVSEFNLSEDSEFLSTFLPGEDSGAYRVDDTGQYHYAYPDANSKLVDFTYYLTDIEDGVWEYFGLVTTQTVAPNQGTLNTNVAVTMKVTSDGDLQEIRAYAVPRKLSTATL